MDMFITLIIQIISGAVGGNLAGLSKQGLGSGLNTVVGGVGGLVLGQIVSAISGLVLTFVVGWIKNKMAAK